MPQNKRRKVVFDPEARNSYLRGFSERKRQRRAYGLAQQRVKDRKAKIDQRKAEKKDELQRIEQAEQQKEELMEEKFLQSQVGIRAIDEEAGQTSSHSSNDDGDESASDSDEEAEDRIRRNGKKENNESFKKTYSDKETEVQWGGHVTVETTALSLDEELDDEIESPVKDKDRKRGAGDLEQRYAGSVEKYMNELKGSMPGKRKKGNGGHHAKRKGKNGASDMKGIGGAGALKVAQKVLLKTKQNQKFNGRHQQEGGKKKRKRRR